MISANHFDLWSLWHVGNMCLKLVRISISAHMTNNQKTLGQLVLWNLHSYT